MLLIAGLRQNERRGGLPGEPLRMVSRNSLKAANEEGEKLMKITTKYVWTAALAAVLAAPIAFAQDDVQSAAQKALSASRFKDVQVSVQGGIATLSGMVDLLDVKLNAEKKVQHVKGVEGVRDTIQVAGPEIADAELQDKLVRAIQYDRVGYGTTAFNSISVAVQNGVVTLGGFAYGPTDAASAVSVATNTKGVKDLIDEISVNPPSPNDDRIRMATYRAIYGAGPLNKYAIDPGKPIRIQVSGGNVTLYGVVDSQGDKNLANIRANTVPGVFSVKNELVVAKGTKEKP